MNRRDAVAQSIVGIVLLIVATVLGIVAATREDLGTLIPCVIIQLGLILFLNQKVRLTDEENAP